MKEPIKAIFLNEYGDYEYTKIVDSCPPCYRTPKLDMTHVHHMESKEPLYETVRTVVHQQVARIHSPKGVTPKPVCYVYMKVLD